MIAKRMVTCAADLPEGFAFRTRVPTWWPFETFILSPSHTQRRVHPLVRGAVEVGHTTEPLYGVYTPPLDAWLAIQGIYGADHMFVVDASMPLLARCSVLSFKSASKLASDFATAARLTIEPSNPLDMVAEIAKIDELVEGFMRPT